MHVEVFHEIALMLLIAAGVGVLGAIARQPVIVSFIAVGILAAALFDSGAETMAQISFLAELGIAILLFLVGLKLDVRLISSLGPVALATGLGQVAFTAFFGFLIGLALGLDPVTAVYVAVALTFSSTIIIVKLLTDKRELETLHGRIALGFLIVQDIVVVIAMVVLSTLGIGGGEDDGLGQLAMVLAGMVGMLAAMALFIRYAAEPVMARFAQTPELLIIYAIGWAAAAAAVGDLVGFGKELGGLAAGISLGSTSYREMISARLASLREFLLLFFFLSVGAMLDLSTIGGDLFNAVVFSLFVLIGNPLIVIVIMWWMGYRTRTGFLAGLTVAQISEFSLIFMAMGLTLGHIDGSAVALVTLVGLVTIAMSVYMITYSHELYRLAEPFLKPLDRRRSQEPDFEGDAEEPADIILFGLGRFGTRLYERLVDAGLSVLAVDLDPAVVRRRRAEGFRVRYGDVTEQEFWQELPIGRASWVVLSVPFGVIRLAETDPKSGLLAAVRTHRFQGRIALTARDEEERQQLVADGVDLVLYPFDDAAQSAATAIADLVDPTPGAAPEPDAEKSDKATEPA